jgi:hypothetical protein
MKAVPASSVRNVNFEVIGARAGGFCANVKSADDGRSAREHQELHRNAEAGRFTSLDEQQRQEPGRVEHHAHESRPNTCVAFRRQDWQRLSIGSRCWPNFRHFSVPRDANDATPGLLQGCDQQFSSSAVHRTTASSMLRVGYPSATSALARNRCGLPQECVH